MKIKVNITIVFVLVLAAAITGGCTIFNKSAKHKNLAEATKTTKKDSINHTNPYNEVITDKAITDEGLFTVHQVDDNYFFEMPDSLLGRDFLIVSRIRQAAMQPRDVKERLYNGDPINSSTVRFVKGPKNNLFLKLISFVVQSKDSTENGLYRAVQNADLQPIIATFDIKAVSPDSSGTVIDITDFIKEENDLLFFSDGYKKAVGMEKFQKDKSYIEEIKSFPRNLEIHTVKSYSSSGGSGSPAYTYKINNSFVLLPKVPMTPRHYDPRVGYFIAYQEDFDERPQRVGYNIMITRWRLEPRPEDIEKYKRGELVEPAKPIVFYIDPATPKKWVPYLMQAVNDWQPAFEKAGFKNAIYALEAPVDDPEWSLEDARHNAIVYKPSEIRNASGPHIHDPRSGEILESHINWYHNVMKLARDWYVIQAGAIDPRARKLTFDDELMGRLIRFICAHEVGHTLGLQHNLGSSSTVPTDSLRSKNWVEAHGHTPSIMDYARFNYVAQPEDSISVAGIMPRIGEYDEWAIEWGYTWLPEFKDREEETEYMHTWIKRRIKNNKRLWFGPTPFFTGQQDPRTQMEDLGDDGIKSSYYGIENLKRIIPHLQEWASKPNGGYEYWEDMHLRAIVQFYLYMHHVAKIVGGVEWTPKFRDDPGAPHEPVAADRQRKALDFLQGQLFSAPLDWLFETGQDEPVYAFSHRNQAYITKVLQKHFLLQLLSYSKLGTLKRIEYEFPGKNNHITVREYLDDLKAGIWGELNGNEPISRFRRNLQKIYVEQLVVMTYPRPATDRNTYYFYNLGYSGDFASNTDVMSIVKGHKKRLIEDIEKALAHRHIQDLSTMHLMDVRDRLKQSILAQEEAGEIFIQPSIKNGESSFLKQMQESIRSNNDSGLQY